MEQAVSCRNDRRGTTEPEATRALRAQVAAIERGVAYGDGTGLAEPEILPLGLAEIDRTLPAGGLRLRCGRTGQEAGWERALVEQQAHYRNGIDLRFCAREIYLDSSVAITPASGDGRRCGRFATANKITSAAPARMRNRVSKPQVS